jgi:hypothetical protein
MPLKFWSLTGALSEPVTSLHPPACCRREHGAPLELSRLRFLIRRKGPLYECGNVSSQQARQSLCSELTKGFERAIKLRIFALYRVLEGPIHDNIRFDSIPIELAAVPTLIRRDWKDQTIATADLDPAA